MWSSVVYNNDLVHMFFVLRGNFFEEWVASRTPFFSLSDPSSPFFVSSLFYYLVSSS